MSKSAPVCAGDQLVHDGAVREARRTRSRFGVLPAGVCAHAVAAGFIASSSGSAIVAPTPFSTVRREMCFFDRYMSLVSSSGYAPGSAATS